MVHCGVCCSLLWHVVYSCIVHGYDVHCVVICVVHGHDVYCMVHFGVCCSWLWCVVHGSLWCVLFMVVMCSAWFIVMCVVHGCDIVVLVMCMYFVLWCLLLLIVMQSAWFIVDCVVRGCYTCCRWLRLWLYGYDMYYVLMCCDVHGAWFRYMSMSVTHVVHGCEDVFCGCDTCVVMKHGVCGCDMCCDVCCADQQGEVKSKAKSESKSPAKHHRVRGTHRFIFIWPESFSTCIWILTSCRSHWLLEGALSP